MAARAQSPYSPTPLTYGSLAIASLALAPLERIQVLSQTGPELAKTRVLTNTSLPNIVGNVVKNEGVVSFFRGAGVHFLYRAAKNWAYGFLALDRIPKYGQDGALKGATNSFLTGAVAGATAGALVYPLEYIRVRRVTDLPSAGGQRAFPTTYDAIKTTLRAEGAGGVYRGFVSSLASNTLHKGILLTETYFFYNIGLPISTSFCLGLFVTSLFTYPFDTVSRRMIVTSLSDFKYSGVKDAFTSIYKNEGLTAFYRGFGVNAGIIVGTYFAIEFFNSSLRPKLQQKAIQKHSINVE